MQGGACTTRSISSDAGTNSGIVHTDASYCSTKGRKNSHTFGFASVRSMWHRHTQRVSANMDPYRSRRKLRIAAGCGPAGDSPDAAVPADAAMEDPGHADLAQGTADLARGKADLWGLDLADTDAA